jgi:single-strand DNA-binding protein
MAKSVNKVILLGNVGKDPEIKVLPSGQPVANFSIATSERYKDQQGNWQDRTEWHNLTAYGKLAEIVRDKESGKKVYRTEIVVGDISLLSGRGEEGGGSGSGYSQRGGNTASFDQRPSGPSGGGDDYASSTEITDDDIPF